MVTTLLTFHLLGAVVTGGFILIALRALFMQERSASLYRSYVTGIALCGAYELVSGSLLAFFGSGTLFAFCARIGIYIAVIIAAEALLFVRMKSLQFPFPARIAIGSMGGGALFAILSGVAIFAR